MQEDERQDRADAGAEAQNIQMERVRMQRPAGQDIMAQEQDQQ